MNLACHSEEKCGYSMDNSTHIIFMGLLCEVLQSIIAKAYLS